MNDVALRAERVSKQYRIGRPGGRSDSLREALTGTASRSVRALLRGGRRERSAHVAFWALRDVSFEVKHGEVLGIIGQNGAGKSTLLKVLSRITEPTSGRVEAYGRVGSLLEVGTGFHPELTGRENVYLNGSVLGMRKAEVDRKFDEIVEFSGVEMFLDTPVKRYSSGMYVRLAFAVAAHLEPEILIVDEVLAVGDIEFQKRCLRKMEGVARGGRTVLLVSHNMGTVQSFCTRAILLREGAVAAAGAPTDTVGAYIRGLEEVASQDLVLRTERGGNGVARITRCEVSTEGGPLGVLASGRPARFLFSIDGFAPGMTCWFAVYNQVGQPLTVFDSSVLGSEDDGAHEAVARFSCHIEELLLIPGRYRINAGIWANGEMLDDLEAAAFFEVEEGLLRGRPVPRTAGLGDVLMPHRWQLLS
jgi:lipopolysaccharide transport system ATP-binding protein